MSRAFTKEDDFVDDLTDRPISSQPNQVTERGLQMIEQALDETRRACREAHAAGDREALARPAVTFVVGVCDAAARSSCPCRQA
jgi:hypothetical protein